MFYANYLEKDGTKVGHLFDSMVGFMTETDANPIDIIDFKVSGRTYEEKKDSARQLAIDFQHAECGGMFMSEYAEVTDFFRKIGKRFGLSSEFENEGVI
ncbi:MAG: hypothetical protein J6W09_04470 [Bacteroidales bacterium]|nr:hypothetical protein [Bacteroidales bacterium]